MAEQDKEPSQDESIDQVTELKARIEALEKEIQYAKAEIANVQQRASKDRSEALKFGGSSLVRRLLPSIDGLTKALENLVPGEENDSVIGGIRMTIGGIFSALELEGIVPIEANGESFDPTKMEAIATVPCSEGIEPGTVVDVIEQGFSMHDRVLRPARVVVSEGES
ncbi:MAG: nucleotide exchange factor GrpE [Candidatus Thermoplasmatota archaeon]|nr:nucleotide exchange factor GrpE [Candidatus Thermoplasmatota archaeon]